jgi:hypothetical protein
MDSNPLLVKLYQTVNECPFTVSAKLDDIKHAEPTLSERELSNFLDWMTESQSPLHRLQVWCHANHVNVKYEDGKVYLKKQ